MKLLLSPWENVWVKYMKKYFDNLDFSKNLEFNEIPKYDLVLSGWADNNAIALGKFPKLANKYGVFVRSYEYYAGLIRSIKWDNFDYVFFLNRHIMNGSIKKYNIPTNKCYMTSNGVDLNKIKFINRKRGDKVLFLADINHKKGISLLVQVAKLLPKYTFTIAGNIQECRFYEYMLNSGADNIKYIGYVDDINALMKEHHYILCTSPAEGHPNNIIEGMASGLKPVINNYLGAQGQFPSNLIYDNINKCVELLTEDRYNSHFYRNYIEENYDYKLVYKGLESIWKD